MKYHSPFSIIFISITVLLLFASVAFFAVFSVGMTSPTLIVTEKIMEELENFDSDISVSFDRMERSISSGFTIHDLAVNYLDNEILSLSEVKVHMGILSIFRYLITGEGRLDIEGIDGSISVPAIPAGGSGGNSSFALPSFLDTHSLSIHLHGISLDLLGAKSEDAEISAYLDDGIRAEMILPSLSYESGGINAEATSFIATASLADGIVISASADSAAVNGEDFSASMSDPILRLQTPSLDNIENMEIALSLSGAEGRAGDASFSLSRASLQGTPDAAEAVLLSPAAEYGGIGFSSSEADITLEGKRLSLIFDSLRSVKDGVNLYDALDTELSCSIDEKSFSLYIPEFYSDALSLEGSDVTLRGESISLSGSFEELISFSASGYIEGVREGSDLNGIGGNFSFSADVGEKIEDAFLSLSRVHIPGLENEGYIYASYEDESGFVRGTFGNHLIFSGEFGEGIRANAYYTNLPLRPFLPFVSQYIPVLYNYIGENTAATGSVSLDFDEKMTGPMDFALAISDIAFNDYFFSLAASGSGRMYEDSVDIDQVSITSDFIRASFEGSVNFSTNLPEGRFVISMTDSGYELFVGTLTLESNEEYFFSAEIPYFSSSWLRGNVNWSDENIIESSATLKSGDYFYPFDIKIDFLENTIFLDNEKAHAEVDLGEVINGTISFDNFELPVFREDTAFPSFLEGTIDADFSFAEQQFRISSGGFVIGNLSIFPDNPDLSFSMYGDNTSLVFDDILFSSSLLPSISGRMVIDYTAPSIALSLSSAVNESLLLSILRSEDGMFSGLLRADSFNLERFGISGMIGDINLTARAGTWDALSFSGRISAYSTDMINNPSSAEAELYVDRDEIALTSISYTSGNLSLGFNEIRYSSLTGMFTADLSLNAAIERADGNLPVSSSISISADLHRGENLADAISSIVRNRLSGASADIKIGETNLGDRFLIAEKSIHIENDDGHISLSGNLANGSFDIESGSVVADIDLLPVGRFMIDGAIGGETDASLAVSISDFEISVADLFLTPSIVFYAPAPAKGEIVAVNDEGSWNLFGWLSAEEVAFDVFWMPGERVILHNPYFSVWDNSFQSLVDDCTVLDTETYERTPGRVSLTIDLGSSLSMDGWVVDVYAEEDNWIGIRLPLTSSNIDLWGDVTGHLQVGQGSDSVLFMDGDLKAANITMSLGMEPVPEWMGESDAKTTADLRLLLTENVKFIFPLTGDPILRADLAENQNLNVKVDEMGTLDVSGSLDIRSGELFYFQKNFYITEGNISFRQDPVEGAGFNPVINLRARLRDFDSNGDPLDIFLILRDSTLDNLSPSFESAPSKPLSEIMQILGQSILPNSIYGDISVSSMVSLVSASVDILSRIGLISNANDNTLEQSIRSSLALDTFSLHTNIIENLIFDTVSYASSNLDNEALSPMARYLDGTTLYLGKYLSPELYLEGMVHLDAENNRTESTQHTFLADDLNLDIEISLEWDNPLAVFTVFTQPENITLYDILDSFGFGISKRIVW